MFDLSTESNSVSVEEAQETEQKHFAGVLVDGDGMLKAFHFVLEGSYYTDPNTRREYDALLEDYKNKFVLVNNLSSYDLIDKRKFETSSVQIEYTDNDAIYTKTCADNYWGSLIECLNHGLRNEIFSNIYAAGRQVPNMDTKLGIYPPIENAIPLRLIVMTDNGMKLINGLVHHTFQEDRTLTCPSCVQGFVTYENTLMNISKHVIKDTNAALFHGTFVHDMDVSSDEAITETLYETFRQVIELAKIKSIRFEEIK